MKKPFVLLHGVAQVGKSTIMTDLVANYGVTELCGGQAFKCVVGLGFKQVYNLCMSGEFTLDYLRANKDQLLGMYEQAKKDDLERTRHETIAIANLIRLFNDGFWVDATLQLINPKVNHTGFIGTNQDAVEYTYWEQMEGVDIYNVHLECRNSGEKDTREQFLEHYDLRLTYDIEQTHQMATLIGEMFFSGTEVRIGEPYGSLSRLQEVAEQANQETLGLSPTPLQEVFDRGFWGGIPGYPEVTMSIG